MSDGQGNHRKVYAKGYYDGVAATTGKQMTPERHAQLLSGQSSIAQKVYQVVPIGGEQNLAWIGHALKRTTSSTPDMRIIAACLGALHDGGLIRQPRQGYYRRDPDPSLKTMTTKSEVKQPSENQTAKVVNSPLAEHASVVDRLADIAVRLKEMGTCAHRIAADIENAALDIESDREVGQSDAKKLHQLKSLLKELV